MGKLLLNTKFDLTPTIPKSVVVGNTALVTSNGLNPEKEEELILIKTIENQNTDKTVSGTKETTTNPKSVVVGNTAVTSNGLNPEKEEELILIKTIEHQNPDKTVSGSKEVTTDMYVKPILETGTTNNPFSGVKSTKTLSTKTVNISSQVVNSDGLPLENVNIYVEDVAAIGTNQNGKFTLKNIPENASIKISSVGYPEVYFEASKVPPVITLSFGYELEGVDIKNNFKPKNKKSNLLWILLIAGAITYGGYRYSVNKDKKIVKTKI